MAQSVPPANSNSPPFHSDFCSAAISAVVPTEYFETSLQLMKQGVPEQAAQLK
jgi:hypothetical protein